MVVTFTGWRGSNRQRFRSSIVSTERPAKNQHRKMKPEIERNLGEQPIAPLMREHNLRPHDLVTASPVEMTHKMVSRACKGRRLTRNSQLKVLAALNRATGQTYALRDLFNY